MKTKNFRHSPAISKLSLHKEKLPVLYVTSGCIWCNDVVDYLLSEGIPYEEKNISDDTQAYAEMHFKSGQTWVPAFDWHGQILADFSLNELRLFLRQQGVELEKEKKAFSPTGL